MEETNNTDWFKDFRESEEYTKFKATPVAYFSAEYALLPAFPTYAGGLGVLAGDTILEANSQEFPIVAVGLLYRKAQYDLTAEHTDVSAQSAGLSLAKNDKGERILISLPIQSRKVFAQAWKQGESAPIYFLDTNIPENHDDDKKITESLYTPDRDERLKQEILLGIGGLRFLEALGLHPSVFHLNEGHSAFLALELVHHEMKHQHVDFATACDYARKHIIFTNHTLVAAGNEQFENDMVSAMILKYAEEIAVPVGNILSLGAVADSHIFSMTNFSLRLSHLANAVSKLHAIKARDIWPKHPMLSITNGISTARWDGVITEDVSEVHAKNKKDLLEYIKEKTGKEWSKDYLLIGWARRFVPYKQPLALFDSLEKLKELIKNSPVPVKIIYSGPTHNDNRMRHEILEKIKEIADNELADDMVFLPNYNLSLAKLLTGGTDLWLNTPVVGTEACGTSGMKAALNGSLPFSTADGWVAEAAIGDIGWIIEEPNISEKIISLLAEKIIPLYKKYLENPAESEWAERMKKARELILKNFGADRMLREYIEKLYIPTLKEKHKHLYE